MVGLYAQQRILAMERNHAVLLARVSPQLSEGCGMTTECMVHLDLCLARSGRDCSACAPAAQVHPQPAHERGPTSQWGKIPATKQPTIGSASWGPCRVMQASPGSIGVHTSKPCISDSNHGVHLAWVSCWLLRGLTGRWACMTCTTNALIEQGRHLNVQ